MGTYVYVVEQGLYSSRGIVGIYASPEAAIGAHPVPMNRDDLVREGGWQLRDDAEPDACWWNGFDWDSSKTITRYEVEG